MMSKCLLPHRGLLLLCSALIHHVVARSELRGSRQQAILEVDSSSNDKPSSKLTQQDKSNAAGQEDAQGPPALQYYGIMQIGSPAQELRVVLDTTSGQLVIPSSKCDDSACAAHKRYKAEKSNSSVQIGWTDEPTKALEASDDRDTKAVSLLGTDAAGEFVRDRLCVGGREHGKPLCAVADFVALIEETDDQFADLAFDGVLGLAPSSPDADEFNVLHALVAQNHLKTGASLFSLYLPPHGDGELLFGAFNKERAGSQFTWTRVVNNGTWNFKVSDIAVDGQATGLCGPEGCIAVPDSAASLVGVPTSVLQVYLSHLPRDVNCEMTLPRLSFLIEGQWHELHKEDLMEKDGDECSMLLDTAASTAEHGPVLFLGYPFLRKFYTVFNAGNSSIGFAQANHANQAKIAAAESDSVVRLVGVRPV